tara:strand:- start:277 stop:549 length:273 start_codon:yes stop_codon:yes gene_type:complete
MGEQLKENEHYQLVPLDDDSWGVRFNTGLFVETVIKFGLIVPNEENESLSFNFDIVSSPDPELTTENTDLRDFASEVLFVILGNENASDS